MTATFQNFIRERQYLHNVSPRTIEWYENSLRWLPCESPSTDDLKQTVLRMREKGLKETGINCVARAVNSYLHWASDSGRKCGPGCTHPRMTKLKEPHTIMPTFTDSQVKQLIAWKPQNKAQRRLHVLVLFLLDTGCRISEALNLRVRVVDMDNLLVALDGKGGKQRLTPISYELRRVLLRHYKEFGCSPDEFLFSTRTRTRLSRDNVRRDVRALCVSLGFAPPARTLHSFRHRSP